MDGASTDCRRRRRRDVETTGSLQSGIRTKAGTESDGHSVSHGGTSQLHSTRQGAEIHPEELPR